MASREVVSHFSTSHLNIFFPADLTKSVYFHLFFHCHYFPYLVLVFLFKFDCSLGNRYFSKNIISVIVDHVFSGDHSAKTVY